MNVGDAVEEEQHWHGRQRAGRGVEAQRHRHGDTTHRADLQIDDHDVVGVALLGERRDLVADAAAVATDGERRVGATEGGDDVLDEPVGVHRQQYTHDWGG